MDWRWAYDLPISKSYPVTRAHRRKPLPLIRQHAFEAHLSRTLRSIDAGGLLDPRTGLLTLAAFNRDLAHGRLSDALGAARIVGGPLCLRSRHARAHSTGSGFSAPNTAKWTSAQLWEDELSSCVRRDRFTHRPYD